MLFDDVAVRALDGVPDELVEREIEARDTGEIEVEVLVSTPGAEAFADEVVRRVFWWTDGQIV